MDDFSLQRLDHANLRTGRLAEMVAFYEQVLGMTSGWRPDFPFPGAWLYVGAHPVVHLIDCGATPGADPDDLRIEHFAFSANGMDAFLARLREYGVAFRLGEPPGAGVVQVNIADPDGNHIHVDFAKQA